MQRKNEEHFANGSLSMIFHVNTSHVPFRSLALFPKYLMPNQIAPSGCHLGALRMLSLWQPLPWRRIVPWRIYRLAMRREILHNFVDGSDDVILKTDQWRALVFSVRHFCYLVKRGAHRRQRLKYSELRITPTVITRINQSVNYQL